MVRDARMSQDTSGPFLSVLRSHATRPRYGPGLTLESACWAGASGQCLESCEPLLSGSSLLWTQALHAAGGQAPAMGGPFPEPECCGERGRWSCWRTCHVPGFVPGGCTDVAHLFLSAPLPGRWQPPYAADEVKEAQRERTGPITRPVGSRAGAQTSL